MTTPERPADEPTLAEANPPAAPDAEPDARPDAEPDADRPGSIS